MNLLAEGNFIEFKKHRLHSFKILTIVKLVHR